MKLHHKEWPSVVLFKAATGGNSNNLTLEAILPSANGSWKQWSHEVEVDRLYMFRSKNRYFQFNGTDDDLNDYFDDLIHPRLIGRGTKQEIEYPVYSIERRIKRDTLVIVSAPYAGLLTELITRLIRPHLGNGLLFLRPLITKVYQMARSVVTSPPPGRVEDALSPDRTSIVLRGGRITLTVDDASTNDTPQSASIRSLTLTGNNILKSELFAKLVDEGIYGLKFGLDPSLAKVAFKHGNSLGVIVKMDQFGNFHYRPGYAGKNLDGVADLLFYCINGSAIDRSQSVPLGRLLEPEF